MPASRREERALDRSDGGEPTWKAARKPGHERRALREPHRVDALYVDTEPRFHLVGRHPVAFRENRHGWGRQVGKDIDGHVACDPEPRAKEQQRHRKDHPEHEKHAYWRK